MENKKYLGVMVDCSRNAVLTVSAAKRLIDALHKMGYNMLMLYTEDTYEIDSQPKFGYLRGRFTKEELKEIVTYGEQNGIELVPCIQTLAHLKQLFSYPEYREIRDCEDILLVEDERTYKLIDDMFSTLRQCYKTFLVHIGMDEADNLGKGKYRDLHGDKNRFDILKCHLEKVTEIAQKYGFEPMMWSDMFFRLATNGNYYTQDPSVITPEIAACVPKNVGLVYWEYYNTESKLYENMIKAHKRFNNPIWFAGGACTWMGFTPRNKMSINATAKNIASFRDNGVDNVILTCWGDNGGECSVFSVLPTLFYAAEVYRGNDDEALIKQRFEQTFKIAYDDFIKIDLPCDLNEEYSKRFRNPDKSLVYNDPFVGLTDSLLEQFPDVEQFYKDFTAQLSALTDVPEFGYLFKVSATLCDFLSVKSTLSVRTREAYRSGDKAALERLMDDYKLAEEKLETFYLEYRKAWLKEKKGNGFEIQDLRLGGVKMRLNDCRMRIGEYLSGEIDNIDDLEQELLPIYDRFCLHWEQMVSNNQIQGF